MHVEGIALEQRARGLATLAFACHGIGTRWTADTAPPGLSIGDVIEYTIKLDNKGLLPLGNILVVDLPPTNLTYISNSTTLNGQSIPDSSGGTAFPIDAPGYTIPVILRSSGNSTRSAAST